MYSIYAFLGGICVKLYDDIVDLKLNINNIIVESIKHFIIVFVVLLSYNDFPVAVTPLISLIINQGIDTDYWKGFLPILILLCIISYKNSNSINISGPLLLLIPFSIFAYIEDKLFVKEISIYKLIARLFGFIVLLFVLPYNIDSYLENLFPSLFSNTHFTEIMLYSVQGYFLVSILTQLYFLFINKNITVINQLNVHTEKNNSYFSSIRNYLISIF